MKCTFNRQAMLTAYDSVRPCISANAIKPVLKSVMLRANGDVRLSATNLEQWATYSVSGVNVDRSGQVLIPAAKFSEILKNTPDDEMTLFLDGDNLELRSDSTRHSLPTQSVGDFPEAPEVEGDPTDVPGERFAAAFRTSFVATSYKSFRTDALCFDLANSTAVSCSGGGMCFVPFPSGEGKILLPPSVASMAAKLSSDPEEAVVMRIGKDNVAFSTKKASLVTRQIEGNFVSWMMVRPANHESEIAVLAGRLLSALRCAGIATTVESNGVLFRVSDGKLTLGSKSQDGSSETSMPIAYDGPDISVSLWKKQVADFLRGCAKDSEILLRFIDAKKPVVFVDGDCTFVTMPITKEAR